MRVEDLKKGFGFKKDSVYRLIAYMDEEFSRKLTLQEENAKKRISELEEKLKALQEENTAQSRDLHLLASTISDMESKS